MKVKYQFFISSTYKDLVKERQIAINTIMKLGHIPAGMELFTATGEEQFESIKPIIDESDYYLIILGGKYGTLIKDEKISYTEKEFNYALDSGKRIIALVYNDPENLSANKRETKVFMINRFKKFRDKVLDNRMVYMWNDCIDLAQGISTSVIKVSNDYPSQTCWIHVSNNSDTISVFNNLTDQNDVIFGKTEFINVFSKEQCVPYYRGMPETLLDFTTNQDNNSLILKIDFSSLNRNSDIYRWAGLCIRSLPCRDWRKYIINNSIIKFSAIATENLKSMWFEIKSDRIEMCKRKIKFENNIRKEYCIELGQYSPTIDDWKWIREICFVIYPEYTECETITITISNLRIES